MPPRKKAAAAADTDATDAGDAPEPRRSSRNTVKAPASTAGAATLTATAAPASKAVAKKPASKTPASKAKAPASKAKAAAKGKGKRARAADEDAVQEEDEDEEDAQPKKKSKRDDKKDDDNADMDDADDVADDKEDDKKKMVTIKKRGAAPVDEHSGMVDTHQVYEADGEIWECMLNQTNIGKNANKYYVIQLLHPIGNNSSCTLYTRWGRVGETGATQKKGPFTATQAISEFKKQFKAKAATDWSARFGMTVKAGKYTWIERSYGEEEEDSGAGGSDGKDKGKAPEKEPDSQLAKPLQDFVKIVFNSDFVTAALSEMNYDANKMPLGKLAKSTLTQGFAALKELAEVINDPNGATAQQYGGRAKAYEQLSGRYYSIIPHDFGRSKPVSIDSAQKLKRELELVDALGDMEIAQKIIQTSTPTDDAGNPINEMDARFRSLKLTSMEPVDQQSKEFGELDDYTQKTHGSTHSHYKVNIKHAFRIEREEETKAWNKAGYNKLKDGERLLLWHGSRSTNFAGILSQGLRIAPPEAPVTGYMFGKGVYFADMMSKSANYCHAHLSGGTGVLLLCEVAAKPFHELTNAEYNADVSCKKAKKLATKGLGKTAPKKWQDAGDALNNDVLKGCHMPAGPGEDVSADVPNAYLQYNEYIVYDVSQIRVRYLLMINMG